VSGVTTLSLCGEFVLVEQPAESVAPPDLPLLVMRGDGSRLDEGRLLLELAVWPMRVVVGDVLAQHRSTCVRETIRMRSRLWVPQTPASAFARIRAANGAGRSGLRVVRV
jgi:hypothetical protein